MGLYEKASCRAQEYLDDHHLSDEELQKMYKLTKGADPRDLSNEKLGKQLFYLKMRHRRTYNLFMKAYSLFSAACQEDKDGSAENDAGFEHQKL